MVNQIKIIKTGKKIIHWDKITNPRCKISNTISHTYLKPRISVLLRLVCDSYVSEPSPF